MTKTNELQLRSINELLDESFFIPAYQRGYRWTSRQVSELLDDVFAFIENKRRSENEFYCLQPVVVRMRNSQWELIDGQQRLTTIFLILSFLNSRFSEDFKKTLFSIEYETRQGSKDYLKSLEESRKDENIDFHHMHQSYQTIRDWFKGKGNLINDIESAFLNDVKVIWYDIREDIDPIAVFSRLNMGKIPLTNAELVKALFLKGGNFSSESPKAQYLNQLKIAQEWDDIERRLQDDEFWFFLTNSSVEANRIEFILKLRADELNGAFKGDPNHIFLAFSEHLKKPGVNVVNEWEKIKRLFLLLDEWFKDRYFYHLVGFLVNQETTVSQIKEIAAKCPTKKLFRAALKGRIFGKLFGALPAGGEDPAMQMKKAIRATIANLDYENRSDPIRDVLLLFNIASLLLVQGSNARFPFDLFKKENWDIEHIRSVHSGMPGNAKGQKRWLRHVLEYLTGMYDFTGPAALDSVREKKDKEICSEALSLLQSEPFDTDEFENLFNKVIDSYDPHADIEVENSIGNLALLDSETNRGYKNAIFPIKRKVLISLDKTGKFVPLCTKNAFLKYYSKDVTEMLVWSKSDIAAHQDAITNALERFFEAEGDSDE